MKDFWKMLLAVVCGLIVFGIITLFIATSALSAISQLAEGPKVVLPRSGVLAVDMSTFMIDEQENPMSSIEGTAKGISSMGLLQAIKAIEVAAQDPSVKLIFLKTDGSISGSAAVEEFRKALAKFRSNSGKPIVAYIESPTTSSYWLASVADKVYMTSYQGATTTINGVSIQSYFLKDLLDKLGVNVQLIRHGKFKSAGEMYTRNSASQENALQYQQLVKSVWGTIRADIAESRGISEASIDEAINNLSLCLPEDFLKAGFVDELFTREQLKEKLANLCVVGSFKDVAFIPFTDYADAKVVTNYKAQQKIAVIYTNGNIIDGSDNTNVAGDRFASIIDKVRSDSTIKAVVLRVNSPGGSVLASEKIKHELDLLGEQKPLIASYGAYAASGGYWISNNCDKIYSDAVTLTGSIGVFSMIPDFSKTTKKILGVNVSTFSSNKHGDMYGLMRPFDDSEYNYMLRSIESIYDKFTTTVSEGRGIEKERVDQVGQGRVWTGADALSINLVDEIGTFEDALNYAALCAGTSLDDVRIAEYPAPLTPLEQLKELLNSSKSDNEFVKAFAKPQMMARMPYQLELSF